MIQLTEFDTLVSPLPQPFNGQLIRDAQLKDFVTDTLAQSKQPLVILGANWCPDAQCLEAVIQLPSVTKFIAEHYEIMRVDLGEYDINMDLIECLGIPSQEGIPRVFILGPQGKPINIETNDKWRSARQSHPQEIFDYLQSFIKKALNINARALDMLVLLP